MYKRWFGMSRAAPMATVIFLIILVIGELITWRLAVALPWKATIWVVGTIITCVVASLAAASVRVVAQWERMVVLRFGKFRRMLGSGIWFIVPVIDATPYTLDLRIITYDCTSQRSLSRDNVPVDVDAIIYYKITDAEAAVLNVERYHEATLWGAESILRDLIGRSSLDELLSERKKLSEMLAASLNELTNRWGIEVPNVEIRQVTIPKELEDAISREPAAEREKRARVRLAEAEKMAANIIYEAAQTYERDPVALLLRSMNMLYEMCMEGRSTVIFVPTETQLGMPSPVGIFGLTEKITELGKRKPAPAEEESSESEEEKGEE